MGYLLYSRPSVICGSAVCTWHIPCSSRSARVNNPVPVSMLQWCNNSSLRSWQEPFHHYAIYFAYLHCSQVAKFLTLPGRRRYPYLWGLGNRGCTYICVSQIICLPRYPCTQKLEDSQGRGLMLGSIYFWTWGTTSILLADGCAT